MEYRLQPWVSWCLLPDECCFAKNSMKPRVAVYIP